MNGRKRKMNKSRKLLHDASNKRKKSNSKHMSRLRGNKRKTPKNMREKSFVLLLTAMFCSFSNGFAWFIPWIPSTFLFRVFFVAWKSYFKWKCNKIELMMANLILKMYFRGEIAKCHIPEPISMPISTSKMNWHNNFCTYRCSLSVSVFFPFIIE